MQKDKIIITTLIGITVAFIGMSFVETGGDALVLLVVGLAFVFIVIPIYIAEFDLYYDVSANKIKGAFTKAPFCMLIT